MKRAAYSASPVSLFCIRYRNWPETVSLVGGSFVNLGPRAEGERAKPDFFQHGMSLNAGKGEHTGESGPGTVRARLLGSEFSTAPPADGRRRATRGRICSAAGPDTSAILGLQQAQKGVLSSVRVLRRSRSIMVHHRDECRHAGASTLRRSSQRAQISSSHAGLDGVVQLASAVSVYGSERNGRS